MFPIYAFKLIGLFLSSIFKYDVFHFHFGRSILFNKDLWVYKSLKKKVFFEFHGDDLRDLEKFSELNKYAVDYPGSNNNKIRLERICSSADGIILHDDELITYLPENTSNVFVVPLRLDIDKLTPNYPSADNKKIKIVHAPSDRKTKGSQYVIDAIEKLKEKYDIELLLVEKMTQEEAREVYLQADIIVDQLIIGTYGVFAIEAMALGKPVITYISNEMKERLPEELPIVSATIDNIEEVLERLILDGNMRNELGKKGREYAKMYHDYKKIGKILADIYDGKSTPAVGRDAFSRLKEID